MRVVSKSSELLIVEDRPIFWSLILLVAVLLGVGVLVGGLLALDLVMIFWGGVFGALALVMFLLVLRRVRVFFDRGKGLIEIRTRSVRGTTRQQFRLADCQSAVVQVSAVESETYRIALKFAEPVGMIPTRRAYDSSRSSQRAAEVINAWLHR